MKLVKERLGLTADIIQILTFLWGLTDWIKLSKSILQLHIHPGLKFSVIILALLVIIYLLWLVGLGKISFKEKLKKSIIYDDSKELSADPFEINRAIPDSKVLSRWHSLTEDMTRSWAHDAILSGFTLFVDNTSNSRVRLQISYYSNWKGEIATYYVPSHDYTPEISEAAKYDQIKSPLIPFYLKYKLWKKYVLLSYEHISGRLPNAFKIQIGSTIYNINQFYIWFSYRSGKTHIRENFDAENGSLTHEKTGKKIDVEKSEAANSNPTQVPGM